MIIPVRCYTCGKVIGDKYYYFKQQVAEQKRKENLDKDTNIININVDDVQKTIEGKMLDSIGCIRLCCRKIILSHIELIDEL